MKTIVVLPVPKTLPPGYQTAWDMLNYETPERLQPDERHWRDVAQTIRNTLSEELRELKAANTAQTDYEERLRWEWSKDILCAMIAHEGTQPGDWAKAVARAEQLILALRVSKQPE